MTDVAMLQPHVDGWNAFEWPAKQAMMETTLVNAKEAQKQSAQARKVLSEATKQFKRSIKNAEQCSISLGSDLSEENARGAVKSVESLAKECKTTIKAYQEEIDNMTRRCKSSETSFASLAQALLEQSDPASLMQALLQQVKEQEAQQSQLLRTVDKLNEEMQSQEKTVAAQKKEIQQLKASGGGGGGGSGMNKEEREELISLRREVAEYEVEFRNLKNQDITIRKLETRIEELQTSGEVHLEEQLEKHKEELEEREGRRVAEALDREAALERKVQTLDLQLKAERAGREATQAHLLEADEGVSQREAAWEAQRRILVDDSTRLRETLSTTTRERDELRLKVAALQGGKADSRTPPPSGGVNMRDLMAERSAYEAEVAELSETASLLRDELRMKDEQLAEEEKTSQRKISDLQREIATLTTTVESLDEQLQLAPSQAQVEGMRRELQILKRLEYNVDDVDTDRDPEMTGPAADDKDLEAVLVSKLRRAETDLVKERIAKTDLVELVDTLKKDLVDAEKAKEDADKLVFSLEKDLERMSATPVTPAAEPRRVLSISKDGEPATLQTILDPDAPPLPPQASPSPSVSTSATEKANDDHSVATIVMAQRDRLRARCEALEAERDSFKRELQIQVQSSESLKADNTKLYEKVRYLQSFNKSGRRTNAVSDRDLDLEALEQRYEASVDPFRQFSKAERQRKLNEMPPMERAVFVVAKTVLATKEMRTALFFYVCALHLLVFVTTYHWSHADSTCHNINNEHLAFLPHEQQTAKAAEAAAAAAAAANDSNLRGSTGA